MSDEILELRKEIIALKGIFGKNAELIEKIDKMKAEIESLKARNSQQKNTTETEATDAIQTSQPMKGEKPKPKRYLKNWLLFDTLPWINRKELANSSLSTASETFQQLCWPKLHGNVKPHKIQSLRFSQAPRYELGNFRAMVHLRTDTGVGWGWEEVIPIASIPPLDYILGIEQIEISFINDEVVNFLKSIENLLQNCKLDMILNKQHIASSVRNLMDFLTNKIFLLHCGRRHNVLRLNDFNKFFPGFINNVQFIQFCNVPNIDEIEIILNWLTKQANNEKQKIIKIEGIFYSFMANFINRIKDEFSNSPSIFLIDFGANGYEEFTLENLQTNEILTLYRKGMIYDGNGNDWYEDNYANYYLARYPKGEEHWKKDGENKIREYQQMGNSTSILINMA